MQIQALLAVQGGSTRRSSGIWSGISHGNGKTSHFQWRSRKSEGFCYSIQILFEDEDEGRDSRRVSNMGSFIRTRRISGYMERERDGGVRSRRNGV